VGAHSDGQGVVDLLEHTSLGAHCAREHLEVPYTARVVDWLPSGLRSNEGLFHAGQHEALRVDRELAAIQTVDASLAIVRGPLQLAVLGMDLPLQVLYLEIHDDLNGLSYVLDYLKAIGLKHQFLLLRAQMPLIDLI
jgi:hypothetical protein